MILSLYSRLRDIAEKEFSDIIEDASIIYSPTGRARKVRITLIDNTFVDVWYSVSSGEYSYHWEQAGIRDYLYRHDNAPHKRWSYVKTFPNHCHDGVHTNVAESYLPEKPESAIREFLTIVKKKLIQFRFE